MLTCGLYRHEHANIHVNTSFKHQQLYLWSLKMPLMYFKGKHHNWNLRFYFSQRKPQKQIWTAKNICTWSSFFFPSRYSRFLLKSDSSNGSKSLRKGLSWKPKLSLILVNLGAYLVWSLLLQTAAVVKFGQAWCKVSCTWIYWCTLRRQLWKKR